MHHLSLWEQMNADNDKMVASLEQQKELSILSKDDDNIHRVRMSAILDELAEDRTEAIRFLKKLCKQTLGDYQMYKGCWVVIEDCVLVDYNQDLDVIENKIFKGILPRNVVIIKLED